MLKKILFASAILSSLITVTAQDAGTTVLVGINQSWWYGRDTKTLSDPGTGMYLGKNVPNFEFNQTRLLDDDDMPATYTSTKGTEYAADSYVMALGDLQRQTGYMIGFEVNSELSNHFWLKHQFVFITKGFAYQGTRFDTLGNSVESGISMRLRSYNVDIIPFGLDFQYEGLQAYAGPYVSVLLGSYWVEANQGGEKIVNQTGVYDYHYYDLATDKIEAREIGILDYGAAGGLEYKFPFGMNIGTSYKWGFGRVLEARSRHTKTSAFAKTITVYMGYTFGE